MRNEAVLTITAIRCMVTPGPMVASRTLRPALL